MQLFKLQHLRHLCLSHWETGRGELSVLAPLTALERLELHRTPLPPRDTLAGLSSLTSLKLCHSPFHGGGDNAAALAEAIAELQDQLAELWVEHWGRRNDGVLPPALADCSHLRHLAWMSDPPAEPPAGAEAEAGVGDAPAGGRVLPPGRWLRSLRRLALPCDVALASREVLVEGAPHLECLGVFSKRDDPAPLLPLLQFAAQHPPVRRLVASMRQDLPPEVAAAAAAAQQQRPALELVWTPSIHWVALVVLGGDAELARMRKMLSR